MKYYTSASEISGITFQRSEQKGEVTEVCIGSEGRSLTHPVDHDGTADDAGNLLQD